MTNKPKLSKEKIKSNYSGKDQYDITPVENLYQPKFAHGLYGCMMNGVQMVDMLLDRKFNDGNSLFNPGNK